MLEVGPSLTLAAGARSVGGSEGVVFPTGPAAPCWSSCEGDGNEEYEDERDDLPLRRRGEDATDGEDEDAAAGIGAFAASVGDGCAAGAGFRN